MSEHHYITTKEEFDSQFNIIRIFGTIIVVLMHSTIMYTNAGVVTPKLQSKFFEFISWYFYHFMMELFMLLSGIIYAICLKRPSGYSGINLIITKFMRLMIPYYLIGFLYVAPIMIYLKITKKNYIEYSIKGIIFALDCRHLWYLLTLFDIFIFVDILQFFVNTERKSAIILFISSILLIISRKIPNILFCYEALYFFFFFCLGYFLCDKLELINIYFSNHLILWIFLGIASFPLSLYGRKIHDTKKAIRAFPAIFFYFYLAKIISKFRIENNILFDIILKNGMGIYLLHPMLIYLMYFKFSQKEIKPWIMVFSSTFIAIIISIAISEILRFFDLGLLLGEY